jgi:hypothetical protein
LSPPLAPEDAEVLLPPARPGELDEVLLPPATAGELDEPPQPATARAAAIVIAAASGAAHNGLDGAPARSRVCRLSFMSVQPPSWGVADHLRLVVQNGWLHAGSTK